MDSLYGVFADSRESSRVLYKLLDILKFDNIVKLSTGPRILAHKIFNKSSNINRNNIHMRLQT